jgi:hypothetical protein
MADMVVSSLIDYSESTRGATPEKPCRARPDHGRAGRALTSRRECADHVQIEGVGPRNLHMITPQQHPTPPDNDLQLEY